jgi:hypothetical protein
MSRTLPTDPIPTGHFSKPRSEAPTSAKNAICHASTGSHRGRQQKSPSVVEGSPKLFTQNAKSSKPIQPVSPPCQRATAPFQALAVPYSYALSDTSLSSPSKFSAYLDSLSSYSDDLLYDTAEEDLGGTSICSGTPSDMESLPGQSDIEVNRISSTSTQRIICATWRHLPVLSSH